MAAVEPLPACFPVKGANQQGEEWYAIYKRVSSFRERECIIQNATHQKTYAKEIYKTDPCGLHSNKQSLEIQSVGWPTVMNQILSEESVRLKRHNTYQQFFQTENPLNQYQSPQLNIFFKNICDSRICIWSVINNAASISKIIKRRAG